MIKIETVRTFTARDTIHKEVSETAIDLMLTLSADEMYKYDLLALSTFEESTLAGSVFEEDIIFFLIPKDFAEYLVLEPTISNTGLFSKDINVKATLSKLGVETPNDTDNRKNFDKIIEDYINNNRFKEIARISEYDYRLIKPAVNFENTKNYNAFIRKPVVEAINNGKIDFICANLCTEIY